jgi:hypothetical protein
LIKICPNCGKKNVDSAAFCENCGEKLGAKEIVKNTKSQGNWWSRQSNGTKAIIGILGICCIGLIVLIVFAGYFAPNMSNTLTTPLNNNSSTSNTTTTSNSTNLNTFKGSGVTFQYPKDWNQYTSDSSDPDRIVALKSDKADISLLSVFVEDAHGDGLEYWKKIQKDALSSNDTIISEKSVQIAGVSGYRLDYSYTNNGGGEHSNIIFVKNGKKYELLFTTGSISAIQNDINTIVNSFKTY